MVIVIPSLARTEELDRGGGHPLYFRIPMVRNGRVSEADGNRGQSYGTCRRNFRPCGRLRLFRSGFGSGRFGRRPDGSSLLSLGEGKDEWSDGGSGSPAMQAHREVCARLVIHCTAL